MPRKSSSRNHNNKTRCFYSLHPWECQHHPDHSEISAYVEASGEWEIVLNVCSTSGASAETMATFITRLINDHQNNKNLLRDAMAALELVIEDNGLTFSSEQAAESVLSRIKRRGA